MRAHDPSKVSLQFSSVRKALKCIVQLRHPSAPLQRPLRADTLRHVDGRCSRRPERSERTTSPAAAPAPTRRVPAPGSRPRRAGLARGLICPRACGCAVQPQSPRRMHVSLLHLAAQRHRVVCMHLVHAV